MRIKAVVWGKKKKNWLSAERREPGGFAALPHCLLESQIYLSLSAHAVKLLIDLSTQFKGFNNGDLCLAWTVMRERGWKSRDTLHKARQELLDKDLILMSRRGDRRRPHLYALTFFAVDDCHGKLDIKATERPISSWRDHEPMPRLNIKITHTLGGLKEADMTRPAGDQRKQYTEYEPPTVLYQPISKTL